MELIKNNERSRDSDNALELTPSQEKALAAIDTYAEAAGEHERQDFREHARRTADLLYVFAGDDVPSQAMDAAYLHDLYDRAIDEDEVEAGTASYNLLEYTESLNLKESEYVTSLLNDMTFIEDIAKLYRERGEQGRKLQPDDEALWTQESPLIPFDETFQLSKNVNIESILIKSCEMLDNLHNPAETNLSDAHDIYEAESFYAPLCEILGYDGLAMELRSHAKQNRLLHQGEESMVVNAARFCHEMSQLGPQSILHEFVTDDDDFCVSNVIKPPRYVDKYSDSSYETINLGEFALTIDGSLLTGNWRIKSVGSLAEKIVRKRKDNINYVPMDVMGMTVISADTESVAQDFAMMAQRVVESDRLHPQKSQSKTHPFVVRGDKAYIERVCYELGKDFVDTYVETKEDDKGYRVSKFTLLGEDDMPTEVQFVTKADRKAGRVGKWAHIFHKLKASGVEYSEEQKSMYASWLEQIYDRKMYMQDCADELMVNPQSLVQGRRAMRQLRMMQKLRDVTQR